MNESVHMTLGGTRLNFHTPFVITPCRFISVDVSVGFHVCVVYIFKISHSRYSLLHARTI